jgi:hypothetical protein
MPYIAEQRKYVFILRVTIYDGCVADGSFTSISKSDDSLLCREDDNSLLCGKRLRDSGLDLPEVCWYIASKNITVCSNYPNWYNDQCLVDK